MSLDTLPIAHHVALLATLIAAITDMRTGRIPNWLTLPLLVLGPAVAFLTGGALELVRSLIGVLVCALVPLLLFARNAMGGGDVKLLAAVGGLLGTYRGIEIQFFSFAAIAFLLLAKMAWEGRLFQTLKNAATAGANLVLPKRMRRELEPTMLTSMRMGAAIFAATAASLLASVPGLF